MTIRRVVTLAVFALGAGVGTAPAAPYLQPDMQTMIQQGGVEGTVLADIFRPTPCCEPVRVGSERPYYGPRPLSQRQVYLRRHRHSAHYGMRHLSAR